MRSRNGGGSESPFRQADTRRSSRAEFDRVALVQVPETDDDTRQEIRARLSPDASVSHPRASREHVCGPKLDGGAKVLHDFAHVPTGGHRALGRRASDLGGGIVLCRFAHMQQHAMGWPRFAALYGIDPVAEAKALAADYQRRTKKS